MSCCLIRSFTDRHSSIKPIDAEISKLIGTGLDKLEFANFLANPSLNIIMIDLNPLADMSEAGSSIIGVSNSLFVVALDD